MRDHRALTTTSTKLPRIQHGSATNFLLYHKFYEQNPAYRALKGLGPLPDPAQSTASRPVTSATADDQAAEDLERRKVEALNVSRVPLTETDLSSSFIVKDRLVKLLDHPGLTNHLLRDKNLLPLLVSPYPLVMLQVPIIKPFEDLDADEIGLARGNHESTTSVSEADRQSA